MSKKITLPSGATVTLKDATLLRVKDRKRVLKSADAEGGDLSKALALGDALIAMLVEEWSFEMLIPALKMDNIDELEMKDYDFLVEQTKDAQQYLFPALSETEKSDSNPKVLTENSKG